MLMIEDFTKLAVGVRVPTDGVVTSCPRCGRSGVPRPRLDGSVRYVHIETSELLADGLRTEPSDSCTFAVDVENAGGPPVTPPR